MDKNLKRKFYQIGLFAATFICTTLAGAEWIHGWLFLYVPEPLGWDAFMDGMQYSIPFLLILTVHEFGHYFTAQYHKTEVSLPYYFPAWLGFIGLMSLGTMGAFIRIRKQITSVTQTFDIGIAGPLAGFVVAIFVIIYGFSNLPAKEYIYSIHPEYELFGENYGEYIYDTDTFFLKSELAKINPEAASIYEADTIFLGPSYQLGLQLGSNLIFDFAKAYIVPENDIDRIPNPNEMFHYPYLFAGFLALFFTALNLIPIGQLDGGHILYGLIGERRFRIVAVIAFIGLLFYAGLGNGMFGIFNPFDLSQSMMEIMIAFVAYAFFLFYLLGKTSFTNQQKIIISLGIIAFQAVLIITFPGIHGYGGWMIYGFLIGRFLGIYHPPVEIEEPLSLNRKILGWIALVIFILSISPQPFIFSG